MALTNTTQTARLDHSFSDSIDDAVQATPEPEIAPEPVKPETPQPKEKQKTERPKSSTPSVRGGKKTVRAQDIDLDDDLDAALISSNKVARGVQKSIYVESDVHQYILDKCKTTGAKYSTVVNLLLRKIISNL